MFSIKNFDAITASIINNVIAMTDGLTDFNIGSNARSLIEANAREIDQLYQAVLKGLYESIPVAIYKAFDFQKLSAGYASGYVEFTRDPAITGDVTILAGTSVKTEDGLAYTVVGDTIMAADEDTKDVYVRAAGTGTTYNVAVDTITELDATISGIASITNDDAFTNGTDDETEMERKLRFQLWLSSIPRAIKTSIEYGATTASLLDSNDIATETVTKALVYEPCVDETPAGDVGEVEIYIWNGIDGASTDLITECQKVIDGYRDDNGNRIPGWKAAGVIATVLAVTPDDVDITMTITVRTGYDFDEISVTAQTAISTYIQGLDIGQPLVLSEIIDAAMGISGVYDVTISSPAANYSPAWNAICTMGTVSISEATTTW